MRRCLGGLIACAWLIAVAACGGSKPHADAAAAPAAPDWARAERIAVSMTEYSFTPSNLKLRMGQPYKIVLRNNGGHDHAFAARGFFRTITAGPLVDRDGNTKNPRKVSELELEKGRSVTFHFIPTVAGEYEVYCPNDGDEARGMTGRIVVEE